MSCTSDEIKELKEEYESYAMSHPCEMNCKHCGLTTTEDDLGISLDCGELTCEGCFEEGKSKSLKEEIKKLKEQSDRMSRFLESREIKYCEKCEEYGEMTDDPENCDGIFQNQKGNFICTDCHEDLPDVCCDCDKPINTQDEETCCADAPKLYKEYYGSELDDGDICYECILHHK